MEKSNDEDDGSRRPAQQMLLDSNDIMVAEPVITPNDISVGLAFEEEKRSDSNTDKETKNATFV